jgi:putative addiction module killer protein
LLPNAKPVAFLYSIGYNELMITFINTASFRDWLSRLKDRKAKARISSRLRSALLGNFGDCAPVGEGVFEMRIHAGPGYRVYYTRRGETVYVLLAGGDKSSQVRDIAKAKSIANALREEEKKERNDDRENRTSGF